MEKKDDYIPFGEEWEKEMSRLPKAYTINMLAAKGIKLDGITEENETLKMEIRDLKITLLKALIQKKQLK